MENKYYNDNEAKFSKLISELKNLSQIKAPDDFEFKLMLKIRNKEFEPRLYKNNQFSPVKFFTPAAVVAAAAVILFFVLPAPQSESENPLMMEPKPIEKTNNAVNNQAAFNGFNKMGNNKGNQKQTKSSARESLEDYRVVVRPNDVVLREKSDVPVNSDKTINLDEYISGHTKSFQTLKRGDLVSTDNADFDFNGFLVREEPDQKTIQRYRAIIDSINKAKAKEDSLRRKSSKLKEP